MFFKRFAMATAAANSPCVRINSGGVPYEELFCLYPKLEPFYYSFEKYYDPVAGRDWMQENPAFPICAVLLYAVLIYWGKEYYMKDRKPYNFRSILAAWNLSLSLFSFFGFIRVFPHMLHNMVTKNTRDLMCTDPEIAGGSGATGLWLLLFVLSKFPELLDTFFIVVHKKPLIFLHWYHHVTVLLYCWFSYAYNTPTGMFFAVMNYGVHAIMYGYYFLMAIHKKPKWFNAMYITYAQIAQMVGGVIITCMSFYYLMTDKKEGDDKCWIRWKNTILACLMYMSYLALFVQFFVQRYFGQRKKAPKLAEKKTL